jgi:hypothetical protein
MTAEDRQAGDDVVARFDIVHLRADSLDYPCGLVPQHNGHGGRVEALVKVHVAMADPSRHGAHQDFVRPRGADVDLLDAEGCMDFAEYGSFHGI